MALGVVEPEEEPMDPELKKRVDSLCKDIRILCKATGNYNHGKEWEPAYGNSSGVWKNVYYGSFDYGAQFLDAPGSWHAYFNYKMHCLGPYWDVERCIFYIDGDGKLVKFEDGEWVDEVHKLAEIWRKLLKGPGHFLSESDINNL